MTHSTTPNSVIEFDLRHGRLTLAILTLAALATFLDTTIQYVTFPNTSTFAGAEAAAQSWVLNAYTIVFAALLFPAGKIADRIGHRPAVLARSTLFAVASMRCGLAQSVRLDLVDHRGQRTPYVPTVGTVANWVAYPKRAPRCLGEHR